MGMRKMGYRGEEFNSNKQAHNIREKEQKWKIGQGYGAILHQRWSLFLLQVVTNLTKGGHHFYYRWSQFLPGGGPHFYYHFTENSLLDILVSWLLYQFWFWGH